MPAQEKYLKKLRALRREIAGLRRSKNKYKRFEEALRISEKRFRYVAENARDWVWEVDERGRYTYASPGVEKVLGYKPEELIGRHFYDFFDSKDIKWTKMASLKVFRKKQKFRNFLNRNLHKDGSEVILQTSGVPIMNKKGMLCGYRGVDHDITDFYEAEKDLEAANKKLKKAHKKLNLLILKDSQTGLYNHRYLEEAIEAEFLRARRYAHPFSVIMLDIDYFKSINDVYGHHFGDTVLTQFARYLKSLVRQYDMVVRYGGEEFIIVSPGINRSRTMNLAERLLGAINLYNFGDKKQAVKLKVSIAVVSYPEDKATSGMALVDIAEKILNKVKEEGGNRVHTALDTRDKKLRDAVSWEESTDARYLKNKIEKLTKKNTQNLTEAIFAFAKTIELKDHYTGEHGERTVYYATEVAKALNLPQDEVEFLKQASILHDLGKIGISEKILLKRKPLTEKEFKEITKHPQIGADIIRPIQFLHDLIPIILYHHEKWNGTGYPMGLKGEEIPIGARIISVADVYQALTSNRPYRKAYSEKKAVSIIKKGSGSQFDPNIVRVFLRILKRDKQGKEVKNQ